MHISYLYLGLLVAPTSVIIKTMRMLSQFYFCPVTYLYPVLRQCAVNVIVRTMRMSLLLPL